MQELDASDFAENASPFDPHRESISAVQQAPSMPSLTLEALEAAETVSEPQSEQELLMMPLMMAPEDTLVESGSIRSRNKSRKDDSSKRRRKRKRKHDSDGAASVLGKWCPAPFVRSTLSVMNFMARLLFWGSVVAMVAAVVWYSYELKNNG